MFAHNRLRAPQHLVVVLDRAEDSGVLFCRERVCLVGYETSHRSQNLLGTVWILYRNPYPRSGICYKGIPVSQVTDIVDTWYRPYRTIEYQYERLPELTERIGPGDTEYIPRVHKKLYSPEHNLGILTLSVERVGGTSIQTKILYQ